MDQAKIYDQCDETPIKGKFTPNQKWACFVCYLKIINFFWKMILAFYGKLSNKLKNTFKFQ